MQPINFTFDGTITPATVINLASLAIVFISLFKKKSQNTARYFKKKYKFSYRTI